MDHRSSGPSRLPLTSAVLGTAWSYFLATRIKGQGWHPHAVHHVMTSAPTSSKRPGVQMPAVLNGVPQKPIEGVSMV